uniref:Transmembrane protein n=1 Tax=Chromera velia CCMP2878 TaxID=1169474 RepID=A0A0G4F9G9_9ALVE|eukprot:Cvel_15877.t1-p1 / transcript=Cvel_15877.t1 / gene=Cvel_15877 / organism=Chromera_velia_CCMP2878 / gene_product=hypothetical protein / transcript_product=hypothetical protein / location=Cvel_scaffold1198:3914-5470(+) / protein_length=519 / sequence_SO=supercontig / SO=protein_coding / is_pseudo=false
MMLKWRWRRSISLALHYLIALASLGRAEEVDLQHGGARFSKDSDSNVDTLIFPDAEDRPVVCARLSPSAHNLETDLHHDEGGFRGSLILKCGVHEDYRDAADLVFADTAETPVNTVWGDARVYLSLQDWDPDTSLLRLNYYTELTAPAKGLDAADPSTISWSPEAVNVGLQANITGIDEEEGGVSVKETIVDVRLTLRAIHPTRRCTLVEDSDVPLPKVEGVREYTQKVFFRFSHLCRGLEASDAWSLSNWRCYSRHSSEMRLEKLAFGLSTLSASAFSVAGDSALLSPAETEQSERGGEPPSELEGGTVAARFLSRDVIQNSNSRTSRAEGTTAQTSSSAFPRRHAMKWSGNLYFGASNKADRDLSSLVVTVDETVSVVMPFALPHSEDFRRTEKEAGVTRGLFVAQSVLTDASGLRGERLLTFKSAAEGTSDSSSSAEGGGVAGSPFKDDSDAVPVLSPAMQLAILGGFGALIALFALCCCCYLCHTSSRRAARVSPPPPSSQFLSGDRGADRRPLT